MSILLALLGVLAISVVLCAVALANAFSNVYDAYRNSGRIDPCRFSEQVLRQARDQVPPDIMQYAPDFPAALDAALQARARGACGPKGTAAPAPAPAAAPPSAPSGPSAAVPVAHTAPAATAPTATPAPPAVAQSLAPALPVASRTRTGGGAPAAVIALALVAAILALASGIYGLARWRGWNPPWLQYLSHAFAEAGFHAEATWAEFTDWVRLGR